MSWIGSLLSLAADRPLLARLGVASFELLACSVLLGLLLLAWRPSSRRLTALLWLAVLAKPVLSLAIGAPVALVRFHAAPRAVVATQPPNPRSDAPSATLPHASSTTSMEAAEALEASPRHLGEAPISAASFARTPDPTEWILLAWLLGVVGLLARRLFLQRRRLRMVASANHAPEPFVRRLEELAREAGLTRIPALRVTDALESPALVGVVRPIVLLPRWMVERGLDGTVEAALRHELAHCRWADPFALLVRDAASVLFFFHPAAWWAGRRLVEALELACDRDCLRDPADAPIYAENLYEILRRIRARRAAACARGVLGFATPGRTARRIASLIDGTSMRPLTRGTAAGAALVALLLVTTGVTLAPAEPRGNAPSPDGQETPAAPKRRERPDVFLLGSLDIEAFEAFAASTEGRIRSLWGRAHEPKVYSDLFDNAAQPFRLKPGDVLVVLLTPGSVALVPEKHRDILPEPWSKVESTLKSGGTVELEHESHGLDVVVLGAKDQGALEKLLATTGKLASLRNQESPPARPARREKPNLFLLGSLGGDAFEQVANAVSGRVGDLWGRPHDRKVYEDLFENAAQPFHLKPGDVLVVLLTPEQGALVPEKHRDLLPEPWPKIESTLKSGGTVELEHEKRGLDVVVLGAKDESALLNLFTSTEKLASLRSHHAPSAGLLRGEQPDVFLLGPSGAAFRGFAEATRGRIGSLTGRPNELKIYQDLFDNAAQPFQLKSGDLLVLLLTPERDSGVPEKYRDLLPEPWERIEATLKGGGTVELEHVARGLDVVVLGAKDQGALEELLATTGKLASLRKGDDSHAHVQGAASRLPAGTRYVVTFDANDRRTASVHISLTGADSPIRLFMSSGGRHVEGGYSHFLSGLAAADAAGKPIAAKTDVDHHGGYSATIDRPATIDYKVALQHDASPWPEGGPDEAPYATADDLFWTGRALFLGADFEGAEVEFKLPDGWHVSVPWEPVAGRPNSFRVASFEELTEAFLLAGTHEQWKAQAGELQVVVAVGKELGKSGELLRDCVQKLLDAGAALFDGTPPGRKLLVGNRGSWSGFNGGVFGQSISLLSDRGFEASETGRWFPFVGHEIVHLWNGGGGGLRSRDKDYWFSEGFTEYYAWVLAARLGFVTGDGFLDRVRSAVRAYCPQAGSVSLREADSRALQYDGGFLAALCLDVRLRRKDPKGHGLDDLMREMFRRHGATRKPYSSADVAAVAATLAGDDLDRFFARFVDDKERLPLVPDLAAAGFDLRIDETATQLARDYVIHDVLRIRSLTQTDSGLLVRRSREAGYQDGDLLTEVDGVPVRTFGDLQRVLVGKEPGRELIVRVRREDRDEALRLKAGGHGDPPMEHAVDVRLARKPGDEAPLLDRILAR